LRCMSLPQSPLLFSALNFSIHTLLLAILAHCTDCTIYITLHYPHTHKHKYSILALSTQAHEHYLCTLCTTFLVNINTDTTSFAHCNICIISVYTPLPVNMFSLCVLFFYCDSTVICVCMFVS